MATVLTITLATGLIASGTVLWEFREDICKCVRTWCTPKARHNERLRRYSKHHLIDHPMRNTVLRRVEKGRGIYVFGGPQGCGKSTLLSMAVQSIRDNGSSQQVLYFRESSKKLLKDGNLHRTLNIPINKSLSEYLAKGTVIIIDQFDLKHHELKADVVRYIRQLASDSYHSDVFHVLIVVSDHAVIKALLDIHTDHIHQACFAQQLKWRHSEAATR